MKCIKLFLFILIFTLVTPCHAAEGDMTQRAITEYANENYEEALDLLLQARKSGDLSATNDYYTGLCIKQAGQYDEAVKSFSAALTGPQPVKKCVVDLISSLFNLERYDEALTWINWGEKEAVDPSGTAFLKGQIFMKKKRFDDAVVAFNNAKTGDESVDQQVGIQIASAHVQNNKFLEARAALQAVITRNPNTDLATFAKEFDQKLSAIKPPKRLNIFLGSNYQYDTNVLASSGEKLRDSSIGESLRVEYDVPLPAPWTLNAQYSVNNMNYLRYISKSTLSQSLSITTGIRAGDHVFSLPLILALSDNDATNPPSTSKLSYHKSSFQYTVHPTDTYVINQTNLFQTSFSFSQRKMFANNVPVDDNGDANLYSGQLGYIYLFSEGGGMLNVRGEVGYENTHGANGKNLGKKVGADLLYPLAEATKLIVSSEFSFQKYDSIVVGRKVISINSSLTINQRITPIIYLNLIYSNSRAISTIDTFNYLRNLVSTGLEVRF